MSHHPTKCAAAPALAVVALLAAPQASHAAELVYSWEHGPLNGGWSWARGEVVEEDGGGYLLYETTKSSNTIGRNHELGNVEGHGPITVGSNTQIAVTLRLNENNTATGVQFGLYNADQGGDPSADVTYLYAFSFDEWPDLGTDEFVTITRDLNDPSWQSNANFDAPEQVNRFVIQSLGGTVDETLWSFDLLEVQVVPEPASAALLAMAGLGLMARRRAC